MSAAGSALLAPSDSLVAPVLVGLTDADAAAQQLDMAWRAASDSVPLSRPLLNVVGVAPGERKAKVHPIRHTRALHQRTSPVWPHIARLCDGRAGDDGEETWERWRWMIKARSALNTAFRADLPEHPAVVLIDVPSFRMSSGRVLQAGELALFRHLVVTGLLALCPSAQAVGGLSSWDDDWWAEAPAG